MLLSAGQYLGYVRAVVATSTRVGYHSNRPSIIVQMLLSAGQYLGYVRASVATSTRAAYRSNRPSVIAVSYTHLTLPTNAEV